MALRGSLGLQMGAAVLVTLVGVGAVTSFAGCQGDDTDGDDLSGKGSEDAGARRDSGEPAASEDASSGGGDGEGVTAPGDGGTARDAHTVVFEGGSNSDADGSSPTGTTGKCVPDYGACGSGAGECCNLACSSGACGGFLAEGEHCTYDGGTPPDGAPPCTDKLACNHGFCGTSACVPDGTGCGPDAGGVICCNDDCNGTTCGGT